MEKTISKESLLKKLVLMGLVCGHVALSGSALAADIGKGDPASQNVVTITGTSYNISGGKTASGTVATGDSIYGGYSASSTAGTSEDDHNEVTIGNSSIGLKAIYGGYGQTGASYNKVTVESTYSGTVAGEEWKLNTSASGELSVVGGFSEEDATNNTVEIAGGTYSTFVYGGQAYSSANYNKVNISGGNFTSVYAGSGVNGDAIGNELNISGGTYSGMIIGGIASNHGDAKDNTVEINGGNVNVFCLAGGAPGGGKTSSNNTLILGTSGVQATDVGYFQKYTFKLTDKVTAGSTMLTTDSESGIDFTNGTFTLVIDPSTKVDTKGQTITLLDYGTTLPSELVGKVGVSTSKGVVSVNSDKLVFTLNSDLVLDVKPTLKISGNEVEVTSATTATVKGEEYPNCDASNWRNVYGGYSTETNAVVEDNTVTIAGTATVSVAVFGGFSDSGAADHNQVTLKNSSVNFEGIYGGKGGAGASYNTVTVESSYTGTIPIDGYGIIGGYSWDENTTGNTTGNTVNIGGGTYNSIVYGGSSVNGNATGNTVKITGGSFGGAVCGGFSKKGESSGNVVNIAGGIFDKGVYGGNVSENGSVNNNHINISGGTFKGNIYSGYVTAGGSTSDNTITITGTGATYLGTSGTMKADSAVTLDDGTNEVTFTIGNGTDASALTFASGLNINAHSTLNIQKNSTVTLEGNKGNSYITGTVTGTGTMTVDSHTLTIGSSDIEKTTFGGSINLDYAILNLTNVTIDGRVSDIHDDKSCINLDGTVEIKGGIISKGATIVADEAKDQFTIGNSEGSSKVELGGGSITDAKAQVTIYGNGTDSSSVGAVSNVGMLNVSNVSLSGEVSGTGTLNINGKVSTSSAITNTINIVDGGSLTVERVEYLTGTENETITNVGTIELCFLDLTVEEILSHSIKNDEDLFTVSDHDVDFWADWPAIVNAAITGNEGTININGAVESRAAITQKAITIADGGRLMLNGSTVTVGSITAGTSEGTSDAYAIYAMAGTNTVTLTGDNSFVKAQTASGNAYSVYVKGADTKVTVSGKDAEHKATLAGAISNSGTLSLSNIAINGQLTLSGGTVTFAGDNTISSSGSGAIHGVSATSGTNVISATDSGTNTIAATSDDGDAYGVAFGNFTTAATGGSLAISGIKSITATAGSNGTAYGICANGGTVTIANSVSVTASGGTANFAVFAHSNDSNAGVVILGGANKTVALVGDVSASGNDAVVSIEGKTPDTQYYATVTGNINPVQYGKVELKNVAVTGNVSNGDVSSTISLDKNVIVNGNVHLSSDVIGNDADDNFIFGDGNHKVYLGSITITDTNAQVTVSGGGIEGDNASSLGSVSNDGTLNVSGVTLGMGASGTGTLNITGAVKNESSSNPYIENKITVATGASLDVAAKSLTGDKDIVNNGTITLATGTGGNLSRSVTNNGELKISVGTNPLTKKGSLNADISGTEGTTTINGTVESTGAITQKEVKIDSGKLTMTSADLTAEVTVANGATLNIDSANLQGTVDNSGTVELRGNLTKSIGGTSGITILQSDTVAAITANVAISGTLDGNFKTIDMTGGSGDNQYTTLTIGKLAGTADLKIDANLSNSTCDIISITSGSVAGDNAVVNLTNINITKDIQPINHDPAQEGDPEITIDTNGTLVYVTEHTENIDYQLNGAKAAVTSDNDQVVTTATNNYVYTFALGEAGKLNFTAKESSVTFSNFIADNLDGATTLSLTKNMTDGSGTTMKDLNINLNGNTLGEAGSAAVVTVGTNTMTLNGGDTQGTVNTGWSVTDGGTLNIGGKIVVNGAIANSGMLNLSGATLNNQLTLSGGTVTFAGDNTISSSSSGEVYGVKIESGTNIIKAAADGENSLVISAYSEEEKNYGIMFGTDSTGKSDVLNVNKIKSGFKDDGTITDGMESIAYGIYAKDGVNKVTLTGSDKSITAKSSGTNSYGLYLQGGNNSIGTVDGTLTKIDVYSESDAAIGIFTEGGTNKVVFSGGTSSIAATFKDQLSESGTALGIGLTGGTNDITGLGSITADINRGEGYGIYVVAGTNTIEFTGTDSFITVNSGDDIAYGIYASGTGTTEIANLQGITVSGNEKAKVRVEGGILNLKNSTISAAEDVVTLSAGGGTMNLLSNSTLAGAVMAEEDTTTAISVDSTSTLNVTSITGEGTLSIANDGTLILDGVALAGDVTGAGAATAGTTTIKGTVDAGDNSITQQTLSIAEAAQLTAKAANLTISDADISNAGTLILTDTTDTTEATLGNNLTGTGTLQIGTESINAIVSNSGGKTIANALVIKSGSTFSSDITNLTGSITNAGTFNMSGNLTKSIAGAGTTVLQNAITVTEDRNVEGILNANGQTIDMQDSETAAYTTLTVGKLVGTANLKIDVDLKDSNSDNLTIGSASGATLNLISINVRKDVAVDPAKIPQLYTNELTYATDTVGVTYTLDEDLEVKTATNSYVYEFTLGSAGKLNYTVSAADVTFKKFIEGGLEGTPGTLSLTDNMVDEDADMAENSKTALTINLNGKTLGSAVTANTVAIGAKTMNLDGGETEGTVYTSWTMEEGGELNISGLTKMEGTITGSGTLTNSGTLTMDADNLGVATTNTGTIQLTGGELGGAITGGTVQVQGEVAAAGDNLVNTAVTIDSGKNLTLTSGTIRITGTKEFTLNKGTNITATGNLTIDNAAVVKAESGDIFTIGLTTMPSSYDDYQDEEARLHSQEAKDYVAGNTTAGGLRNDNNLTFKAGSLELDDKYYTLDYQKSAKDILVAAGATTSLVMNGNLVQYKEQGQQINNTTTDQIDDYQENPETHEEVVVTYDKVTAETINGSLLIGSNKVLSQEGAVDAVKNDTNIVVRDTSEASISVNQLNFQKEKETDVYDGVVITKNRSLTVGGSQEAGQTTELMYVTEADGTKVKNNPLKVVVGLTNEVADSLQDVQAANKTATLNIGNTNAFATNNYYLNGSLIVNPESQVNVVGQTTISQSITLNGGALAIGEESKITTPALTISKDDDKDAVVTGALVTEKLEVQEGILFVGSDAGKGQLSVAETKLNNQAMLLDPIWVEGAGIAGATNYATETQELDGAYIVGRNSVLTLGSSNNGAAEELFNDVTTQKAIGTEWGENGITAGAYIAQPVNLSTGSLVVDGSITSDNFATKYPTNPNAGTLNFAANSLLMVPESFKNSGEVVISGITVGNLAVDSSSILFLEGADTDDEYKILAGAEDSIVSGNTWSAEQIKTNAVTRAVVELDETNHSYYNVKIVVSDYGFTGTVAPEAFKAMNKDESGHKYIVAVTNALYTTEQQNANMNRNANMPEELGVMHNHFNVTNISSDAVAKHLALDEHTQGREIWAQAIHNKENVSGLGLNVQGNSYDTQYNGAIVGVDILDNGKTTLGAALTYIDGKATAAGSHNEGKYYGATLYGRTKFGKDAGVQYDISYTHSKNELDMYSGCSYGQITGDQKVNSFSVGARLEQELKVGKSSSFVPHIGARWLRMKAGSFTNSLGNSYNPDATNSFILPLGLSFKAGMENSGWKMSFLADAGYQWNAGNRDYTQHFSYNGAGNAFDVNFADRGNWYAGAGFEFNKKNFTAGVSYRYAKGDSTRQNKWNVNLSWSF